jgi:hypothetical protein
MLYFLLIKKTRSFSDFVGIFSSSVCIVHCVATPLLITIGANFLTYSWLKYVFIIIAFLAIYKATIESSFFKITLLLWASFWVLLFSLFFEKVYPVFKYSGSISSLVIIAGHVLNIRYCKKCSENDSSFLTEKTFENVD